MKIKKITILNEFMGGYRMKPDYSEEVCQRLTITDKGRTWFSRLCFGKGDGHHRAMGCKYQKIKESEAAEILLAVEKKLINYVPFSGGEMGYWLMTVTYEDNSTEKFIGFGEEEGISDLIRSKLGNNNIWAFDRP